MKIIVFSDSHGNVNNINTVLKYFNDLDAIFHLGDFAADTHLIDKKDIPIYYVKGNNDFFDESSVTYEKVVNLLGINIFITHGHLYDVYTTMQNIYYKGMELDSKIMLFGHTHRPFVIKDKDYLILNPGSISFPRGQDIPTFATIETENTEIKHQFYYIKNEELIKFNLRGY